MKAKIALVAVMLTILCFVAYKKLVHSSCDGINPGIPWWPNSGCSCNGLLIGKTGDGIGSAAKYCVGFLE